MEQIGKIIKEERTQKKMSQTQLATLLGITQDSVSLWEQNKRIPDTQYIIQLCKIFEISADYLLGLEDESGAKIHSSTYNNYGTHNGNVKF